MRRLLHFILLLHAGLPGVNALSLAGRRPARRIAIIGTGIAGLSVAHALTNSPSLEEEYGTVGYEVSMFEASKKLNTKSGAGVQLNGGLFALGKINKMVQRAVLDTGLPVSQIQSRCKPWFGSKPFDELLQLDLRSIVEKSGGEVSETLIQDGELLWCAIMRGGLVETLWKTLPPKTRRQIQFSKALKDIIPQPDGSVMCEFSDGTTAGPFDLVIGCDGVKSACKEFIVSDKISAGPTDTRRGSSALYSGLRIKYAVNSEWKEDAETSVSLKQYFGDGANTLQGTYGNGKQNSKVAFLVFLDKDYVGPFMKKNAVGSGTQATDENVDWREGEERSNESARTSMRNALHGYKIPSLDIDPIVDSLLIDFSSSVFTFIIPLVWRDGVRRFPEEKTVHMLHCAVMQL